MGGRRDRQRPRPFPRSERLAMQKEPFVGSLRRSAAAGGPISANSGHGNPAEDDKNPDVAHRGKPAEVHFPTQDRLTVEPSAATPLFRRGSRTVLLAASALSMSDVRVELPAMSSPVSAWRVPRPCAQFAIDTFMKVLFYRGQNTSRLFSSICPN